MSGAPIIQNGKFVGAVTHVLVNDPTIGYGVFADIMIKQLKEVNQMKKSCLENNRGNVIIKIILLILVSILVVFQPMRLCLMMYLE